MNKPDVKQNTLHAVLRSPILPFVLLWAFMTVCHFLFIMGGGDDYAYSLVLHNQGLWEYTKYTFIHWSSRTLVDVPVILMNGLPNVLWKILDPLVIVALGWAFAGLTGVRQNTPACWLVCGLLVLYPWQFLDSAGWVTTTTVFMWTATAGICALYQVQKAVRGHKLPPAVQAIVIIGTLYAANMEQILVVLLPLYLLLCGALLVQKRKVPFVAWGALAATVADLLYITLCPGNRLRVEGETVSWYPNFGMKSLFSKVELGASASLDEVFYTRNVLFFFFLLLLAWLVFQRRKEILFRIAALVPLVVCTVFGMYGAQLVKIFPALSFFTEALTGEGMVTLANVNTLTAFLPLVVLYGSLFCVLVCIYLALGHTADSLAALAVFGFGLLSRMALGFSPTIWTSGPRTTFFWQLATIGVATMLYREVAPNAKRPQKIAFWVVFGLYCLLALYSIQEMRVGSGYS